MLRHGQTDANANDIIQGSSDISRLTDLGRQQAAQVVQALQEPQQQHMDDDFLSSSSSRIPISNVYVSPLTRAQETLQVICTHIELPPAETLSNLREIDFYDWEGRDRTYLQQHYPDAWRAWKEGNPDELIVHETKDDDSAMVHRPLWELWERAGTVWDEIFTRQDNTSVDFKMSSFPVSILIVAHGSLGQALLGTAMGWDATHFRQYEFPNCGMIELIWEEDDDDDVAMTTLPDTTQGVESSFSSSSSAAASAASRPLATRWRWKWPNVSDEWYTLDAKR